MMFFKCKKMMFDANCVMKNYLHGLKSCTELQAKLNGLKWDYQKICTRLISWLGLSRKMSKHLHRNLYMNFCLEANKILDLSILFDHILCTLYTKFVHFQNLHT